MTRINNYYGTICYSGTYYSPGTEKVISHMDEHFETSRNKIPRELAAMSEEKFENLRTFVIYRMEAQGKLNEELKAIKKQDLIDFHENEKKNQCKLSIQVIRHLKKDTTPLKKDETEGVEKNAYDLELIPQEGDATTIVDIRYFKKNLPVYAGINNDVIFEYMDLQFPCMG